MSSSGRLTKMEPSDVVEGLRLYGYGNSYMWMNQATLLTQQRYFDRLASRINSPAAVNNGSNAYMSSDVCGFAHGTFTALTTRGVVAGTWIPAAVNPGVVIVEATRNDAGWDGFNSAAKQRAGFVNCLDSLIRLFRSQSSLQDTNAAFAYTGTWTPNVNATFSGGSSHSTTTPGDLVTITTPVGTDFDLIVLGLDAIAGAAFTVKVDGVDITATLAAQGYPVTTAGQNNQSHVITVPWAQMAIPLRGLSNIAHTVVITHNGPAASSLHVCRLLTPSPTPPTVIVTKCAQLPASGYVFYAAAGGSFAIDQIYNGLIDTVLARFPADNSVISVDVNKQGWNPATMISSTDVDHLHPNDLGSAFIADSVMSRLNQLPARSGMTVA